MLIEHDANMAPASPPRRYVARTHAPHHATIFARWERQDANSTTRSVVSWTTRRTSVTCPSLPTVSSSNSILRMRGQIADLPRHSRPRQVHPYRLTCPTCWYHLCRQRRFRTFHRYPCRRAGAWCHHQVDCHLPVRPASGRR